MSRFLRGRSLDARENLIPEALRSAILQTQLKEDFPPTFLLHGKDDKLVLPNESELTYYRLQELGVEVELLMLEVAGRPRAVRRRESTEPRGWCRRDPAKGRGFPDEEAESNVTCFQARKSTLYIVHMSSSRRSSREGSVSVSRSTLSPACIAFIQWN